jgi:hypothetical protein
MVGIGLNLLASNGIQITLWFKEPVEQVRSMRTNKMKVISFDSIFSRLLRILEMSR